MNNTPLLQLENLDLKLEEFHLQDVNLEVFKGEYFVLLGPTGAGKTVLLEAIAGLKHPQQGSMVLDGQDIRLRPPEKRHIGFVYQEYALFPHLSVQENIAFGLVLMSVDRLLQLEGDFSNFGNKALENTTPGGKATKRELVQKRVGDISQLLRIEHLLGRNPATLSGGEKQRVALARALVVEPRLLLLDEPLSALDPETSETLQRDLKRVHEAMGTTTLHITHNFEEAVSLGDRIGVMFDGRIVQVGEPQVVFRHPENEQVARFVGVRNVFKGKIQAGREEYKIFRTRGLQLAVLSDQSGEARASIRPEDIILSQHPVQSSARNSFQGVVDRVEDRGSFVYVTVRVPDSLSEGEMTLLTCMITHRSLDEMGIGPGDPVYLAFKAAALHVF